MPSIPYIDRFIRNGPSYLFPSEENAVFMEDVKEATPLYQAAWKAITDATAPESLIEIPPPQEGFFSELFLNENKKRLTRKTPSVRNKIKDGNKTF